MLPYRKITAAELEQCLDDPASVARTDPPSRRRILRDAVRSFHRHIPQLRTRLGALLRIRSGESPPDQIWRSLRLLYGGIEQILGSRLNIPNLTPEGLVHLAKKRLADVIHDVAGVVIGLGPCFDDGQVSEIDLQLLSRLAFDAPHARGWLCLSRRTKR
jgi:hypothetical protein